MGAILVNDSLDAVTIYTIPPSFLDEVYHIATQISEFFPCGVSK